MQSLFSGNDCFLTQQKWQSLSSRLSGVAVDDEEVGGAQVALEITHVPTPPWVKHQDEYFVLLAKIPLVLSWGYSIREERRHGITPDPGRVKLLAEQAGSLRSDFGAWHERAISGGAVKNPVEVPSTSSASPFDTVLEFSNPWVGSVETSYWATMLILQEALNQCHDGAQEGPYDEGNQELARNILRATESVGRGIRAHTGSLTPSASHTTLLTCRSRCGFSRLRGGTANSMLRYLPRHTRGPTRILASTPSWWMTMTRLGPGRTRLWIRMEASMLSTNDLASLPALSDQHCLFLFMFLGLSDLDRTRAQPPTDLVTLCQTTVGIEERIWKVSLSPDGWCPILITPHECPQLEGLFDLVHGLCRLHNR